MNTILYTPLAQPEPTAEERALLSRFPPDKNHPLPEPWGGFTSVELLLTEMDVNGIPLTPAEQARLKKIYDRMDRMQGENALPTHIPSDGAHLPPCIFQSPIFLTWKPRASGPRIAAAQLNRARKVRAGYRGSLVYSGPAMTPDHLLALTGILERGMGKPIDEPIHIFPRAFARSCMGWSDSKHSKNRLLGVLCCLQQALVTGRWADDKEPTAVRFVRHVTPRDDGSVEIELDASALHLFRGRARTFISVEDLRGLTSGFETWMLMFVRSSDCQPIPEFRRSGGFTVRWFHELCGASAAMDVDEFLFELNVALEKLKSCGKIKDFLIDGDDVTIVKHGAIQAKEPRKSSFYSAIAGCEVSSDVVDGWELLPEEMESY